MVVTVIWGTMGPGGALNVGGPRLRDRMFDESRAQSVEDSVAGV